MSWLSKSLKKLRPVGKVLGGGLDVVSDFLPPGLRDVGNVTAKLMQNKNLKSSVLGAGMDYLGGRVGSALAGKLSGNAAKAAQSRMGSIDDFAARTIGHGATDNAANVLKGAGQMGLGGKMMNIAKDAGGKAVSSAVQNAIGPRFGTNVSSGSTASGGSMDVADGNGGGAAAANGNGGGSFWKSPGVLEAGIGLAGSALAGYGQGKIADADRKWDKEKFGIDTAPGLQRDINAGPMKDQAAYMLMQRMGLPMSSFSPRDMFNPGGAGTQGGYDQGAFNQVAQNYKPGMGGQSTLVQQQLLKKLGYGQPQAPAIRGR